MKWIKNMILVMFCGLFASCVKWGSKENNNFILQASLLLETKPDSALMLLDSVNAALFNDKQKAEYILLKVQARDNAGLDLSTDIEIFQVREFFIKRNNFNKAALACFYSGKVVDDSDNFTLKMNYYREAFEFAKNTNNEPLLSKILYNMGYVDFERHWYYYAITEYKQALKIVQDMENRQREEIYSLIAIGNSFIAEHEIDSARYYYGMALYEAQELDDADIQETVYNNMMETYIEFDLFDAAKCVGRQALSIATADIKKADIYKNFALLFHKINVPDSARYYIAMAEPVIANIDDFYELATFYHLYYQIEKEAGNYLKALEYFELYFEYSLKLTISNDKQKLLNIQKKYYDAEKEIKYDKKIIRFWKIEGVTFSVLFVFMVFFIIMIQMNIKQRFALKRTEKQAKILHELYSKLKNNIVKEIGIFKKIAFLLPSINANTWKLKNDEYKLIKKIRDTIKSFDAQKFTDFADGLYPGFTDRLKQICPLLDDREINICCLILFDFSNKELDLIINERLKGSLNTIQNWKSSIRRKLNIPAYGNIKSYLEEIAKQKF